MVTEHSDTYPHHSILRRVFRHSLNSPGPRLVQCDDGVVMIPTDLDVFVAYPL